MQGMVKRVEMVTKEEGTCLVAVMPQVPFYNLELTDTHRAGRSLNANSFTTVFPLIRGNTLLRTCSNRSEEI